MVSNLVVEIAIHNFDLFHSALIYMSQIVLKSTFVTIFSAKLIAVSFSI